MKGPRLISTLSVISLLVASLAYANDDVGRAAGRVFEQTRSSIVGIEYSVRRDAGNVAGAADGIVVGKDGLVIASIDFFPEIIQAADFSDIQIWTAPSYAKNGDLEPGKAYEGVLLGRDREAGTAFLRIEGAPGETFDSVEFDPKQKPYVGQSIVIMGILPKEVGRQRHFTVGRVTAQFREPREQYALAVELPLGSPPSQGAPIFSLEGKALGILATLSTPNLSGGNAINLSTLWPSVNFSESLKNPPDPSRRSQSGWIGIIGMQDVTRHLAEFWKLPRPGGVVVGYVIPESPAEQAGVTAEDVILELDGRPVYTLVGSAVTNLINQVRRRPTGAKLPLRIWNDGDIRDVVVVLGERPKDAPQAERFRVEGLFKFTVRELVFMDKFNRDLEMDQNGVVVSFLQGGWAADGGLGNGDIITKIDATEVADFDTFQELWTKTVEERPFEIVLTVVRGETNQRVLVRIECHWGP